MLRRLLVGAVLGMSAGIVLRLTIIDSARRFAVIVAAVLLFVALLLAARRNAPTRTTDTHAAAASLPHVEAVSAGSGVIGGIYGIGGGAIVAPWLAARDCDPRDTAAATLLMTWVTSLGAAAVFVVAAAASDVDSMPRWDIALPLGIGGGLGGILGSRIGWSPRSLRRILAIVAFAAGLRMLFEAV